MIFGLFSKNHKSKACFKCDLCDFTLNITSDPQEFVDHYWEAHGIPAKIRLNGREYVSGPSNPIIRGVVRAVAYFAIGS